MDTFDPFDDLSDLTEAELEDFHRFQAGEWPILPAEDEDPALTEREWQRFRARMGWDKAH